MAEASRAPYIRLVKETQEFSRTEPSLTGGDGGDTIDLMEPRVKALEDKFDKIDGKLTAIGSDLAYLKGKAEGAPSGKDFGELKGRVDSLPTTSKAAALLGVAVAAITILTKWSDIVAAVTPHP